MNISDIFSIAANGQRKSQGKREILVQVIDVLTCHLMKHMILSCDSIFMVNFSCNQLPVFTVNLTMFFMICFYSVVFPTNSHFFLSSELHKGHSLFLQNV